ncbi:MAG: PAS domain S-box protein [Luteolibacter sp.]
MSQSEEPKTFPAESLLSAIITSSEDGIVSKDLQGVVTSWNDGAERLFGYTRDEMVGKPISLLIPEDLLSQEDEILSKIRNGERVEHFETIRIRKDGRKLNVSLTISPVRDLEGRIVGASKIARDITDQKANAAALTLQTKKLSVLNQMSLAFASELDLQRLVQAVTDAGRELSGAAFGAFFYNVTNDAGEAYMLFTLSGAPREAFEKFGMPRNTPIFAPTFAGRGVVRIADVLQDPRYGTMSPHHGMPKGHLPVRSYLAVPVISRRGDVLGGLFFGHPEPDIFTPESEEFMAALAAHASVAIDNARLYSDLEKELEQQRVLERALRESEALSSGVFDSTADCIKVVKPDGSLMRMNIPGLALFGLTDFDQIAGKRWQDLWPEAIRSTIESALESAVGGSTVRFQGECPTAAGVPKWWDVIVSPLKDALGDITRLTATSRDITALKAAEKEAEAATEEALRQGRMKDEFLATLSHELRTPLQAILGWTHLLKSPGLPETQRGEGLDVIYRNAQSQTRIIEDLLDMNRILSGKIRLDIQTTSLGTILAEAVETVQPAAQAKGITFDVIPDLHPDHVAADRERLQQVFWNLLSNAIKFTPAGGRVEVRIERADSHLEAIIMDNGMGIEPEFLPFVFERFRQADPTTTRKHGGLGLGLAIVKNLVESHGGTIRAKSAGLGQGATFFVSLPLASLRPSSAKAAAHSESSTPPVPTASLRLKGVRILVVDDEADGRQLVAHILSGAGATVRQADSVAAALEQITIECPDVLVSDIGMPGRDGYSLIRELRRAEGKGRAMPALALTAYTRSEDRVRAIAEGFQMHLAKPADPDELLVLVASLAGALK